MQLLQSKEQNYQALKQTGNEIQDSGMCEL